MRKIAYFILVLGLVWLAKLSYDVAQYSQTIPQLQQQLVQSQQQYSLLNDQLVGLQRQLQDKNTSNTNNKLVTTPITIDGIAPAVVIKQKLQLVQFAVDQQQFIFALEQLNQLQQQMAQHQVSPALQHGLIKAMEQDKQNIQQYVLLQTQQRQQFDTLLQYLDQQLQQEMQKPDIRLQKNSERSWWQWFKFEKVQRTPPDLIQRSILLKEAQLRLLLAEQALHLNQATEYRKSMQEVMLLLEDLPDRSSQQMKLRVEKMLNLPVIPAPKLTTLGLLG
ncbi:MULTISPECIES: hypothetical protein [Acinetobacter]|mgnify:FL=1|jgi:uncharacterized coiled-coil protein SlyX|uniref:hypothetical protein n=1 Tax=Acinetobacter TaxID=469 RepID=UPI0005B54B02|nr:MULTISPECIES: hypothetical protein [Acinetobacter]MBY3625911.1 hypothetical protein [Acinetobacter sp. CUI P1]MBL8282557.1 hypothetical protein [Acinetobacter junii]MDA3502589.1 hypothetical protein [Acinetobacter sp. AOR34_HL]MDA3509164.1 hypothetical protein [Acinetobacter junii]MDA3533373.1 hypothetical protein [Acinetobacter junii]